MRVSFLIGLLLLTIACKGRRSPIDGGGSGSGSNLSAVMSGSEFPTDLGVKFYAKLKCKTDLELQYLGEIKKDKPIEIDFKGSEKVEKNEECRVFIYGGTSNQVKFVQNDKIDNKGEQLSLYFSTVKSRVTEDRKLELRFFKNFYKDGEVMPQPPPSSGKGALGVVLKDGKLSGKYTQSDSECIIGKNKIGLNFYKEGVNDKVEMTGTLFSYANCGEPSQPLTSMIGDVVYLPPGDKLDTIEIEIKTNEVSFKEEIVFEENSFCLTKTKDSILTYYPKTQQSIDIGSGKVCFQSGNEVVANSTVNDLQSLKNYVEEKKKSIPAGVATSGKTYNVAFDLGGTTVKTFWTNLTDKEVAIQKTKLRLDEYFSGTTDNQGRLGYLNGTLKGIDELPQ